MDHSDPYPQTPDSVATPIVETSRTCTRCAQSLPANALTCSHCHALVHADELARLTAEAKALEAKADFRAARERWLGALPLLPEASTQAEWVRQHAVDLYAAAATAEAERATAHPWLGRLGPLAPLAVLLMKSKALLALLNLKFLLTLGAFLGFYWSLYGTRFGVGFAVLILLHEMGHFIDIKRRGLPAEMPVFLPGLGAYVRWQALGVSQETRAAVSLAGPLAGCVSAAACAGLWWYTGNPLWAALARAGAWLNVLNLIPVWVLDGGQAANALSRAERVAVLTAALVLCLMLRESVFFLVALGATWRVFTKDAALGASFRTTAYFVAILTALGVTMWLMPGNGFGTP